jgi:hypothetical protein
VLGSFGKAIANSRWQFTITLVRHFKPPPVNGIIVKYVGFRERKPLPYGISSGLDIRREF